MPSQNTKSNKYEHLQYKKQREQQTKKIIMKEHKDNKSCSKENEKKEQKNETIPIKSCTTEHMSIN